MSTKELELGIYQYFRGMNVHFCDNLKRIRKDKGMSQDELAELSGMSKQHISRMESGHQDNPGIKTVVTISTALGVSIEELVFGSSEDMSSGGIAAAISTLDEKDQEILKRVIRAYIGHAMAERIK